MRCLLHFGLLFFALALLAQSKSGELRLKVIDRDGLAVKASIELSNDASGFHRVLATDDAGALDVRNLTFGRYSLRVEREGFALSERVVEINSQFPQELSIKLGIAAANTSVQVTAENTLIDPDQAGSTNHLDQQAIADRVASLPGRSLQDLVNSQPGWLYEGNAVLHPRGSEYQTQFVVDGIPLTDNRSPSFGPATEADDIDSLTIYTAGVPAEYGRKMGGIVELNTLQDSQPGLHGELVLAGGSFDSADGFARAQYSSGHNTLGASVSGSMTAHYLNPVVPENYTNHGTVGDFAASFERDFTPKDHLMMSVRHALARYEIPNEQVQENGAYLPNSSNATGCPPVPPANEPSDCIFIPGGQIQNGDNFETMGSISYQHTFSSDAIGSLRGMSRDNSNDFYSNPESWPLIATQHNYFKEIYFNGSLAVHHGRQEWKAGVESDNIFLHENFNYVMPDCANPNDPQCPINLGVLDAGATTFAFTGARPDLEQAAYVEDAIGLGNWSADLGLRWDHYQLLLNQNAVSPRVAISHYFPSVDVRLHASYDRIFQTPSFENILLSSDPAAEALDTRVAAVENPVQPSHGNYYELGATRAFFGKLRLDTNMFRRTMNNYADDNQILSTGISFPIAFAKAMLYGAEGKLQLLQWRGLSGFASYSYIVGNAWNPVTGGLLLGNNAAGASTFTGHFPDSQDQRNTFRGRVRYQIAPRFWVAAGCDYNSGLPFQADLTPQQYAAEYGPVVINHLTFNPNGNDRIKPYFTQNVSVGADLYEREKQSVRLQADVQNMGNTLELIDFGGLFSGNAIGPSRTFSFRLQTTF